MSKNIVDSAIEVDLDLGFIPSRRQLDHNGGYVNHWNTQGFVEYVRSRSNKILIQRDHAGPAQGRQEDDGYVSLKQDCKCLDLIHIDPWKKYPKYQEGLKRTIDMIEFCFKENPQIEFEVGTEEAIREFNPQGINSLINDLQDKLKEEIFAQIKYVVVQSGTALHANSNTGVYSPDRMAAMIYIVKSWGLLSKEHNADYIPTKLVKEKMSLGLDSINIAPELGLLETETYISNIGDDKKTLEEFWEICYHSNRWKKWVNNNFDPFKQKLDLIKICGHYVLSDPRFIKIKSQFMGIEDQIKNNIKNKVHELFDALQ